MERHEWDEIAESIGTKPNTLDEAREILRAQMPGESEQLINNVAWSMVYGIR